MAIKEMGRKKLIFPLWMIVSILSFLSFACSEEVPETPIDEEIEVSKDLFGVLPILYINIELSKPNPSEEILTCQFTND